MDKKIYGLVQIDSGEHKIRLVDDELNELGASSIPAASYERTVVDLADRLAVAGRQRRHNLAAVSLSVVGEVERGRVVRGLSDWRGRSPGTDLATALKEKGLEVPADRIGVMGHMTTVALSQYAVSANRGGLAGNGLVLGLGDRFEAARFSPSGNITVEDPAHYPLRDGAQCVCGQDGHVGAHISGQGIRKNRQMPASQWLRGNATTFVNDLAKATADLIGRHEEEHSIKEVRWLGDIAMGYSSLRQKAEGVAAEILRTRGIKAPSWEPLTVADARMHGNFVHAQQIAAYGPTASTA